MQRSTRWNFIRKKCHKSWTSVQAGVFRFLPTETDSFVDEDGWMATRRAKLAMISRWNVNGARSPRIWDQRFIRLDYEIEISGWQLTLRERKPRPGYEQLQGEGEATMSRGERFARPSVHLAINFAHKACLPRRLSDRRVAFHLSFSSFALSLSKRKRKREREIERARPPSNFRSIPPLQLVSSTTLDTFLLFDTRTQSNPWVLGSFQNPPYDLV